MVWNIRANDIVYVKYKNVHKTKPMVLNGQVFPASLCVFAMIHVLVACMRRPMEGNIVCHYTCIAAMTLAAHIKPLHDSLSQPFNACVWEY